MELAILMIIGILFLVMSLTIWRLRVKQHQDEERRINAAYTVPGRDSYPGEPWTWPKSEK
jgi:hypothetical protein